MVATRLVALVPTVIMAVVFEASNTFDKAAQLLNVGQSLLLPFALLPVVHMTASREVMGDKFVNHRWHTVLTGSITGLVVTVNSYLMYDLVRQQHGGMSLGWIFSLIAMNLIYYGLVLYYAIGG